MSVESAADRKRKRIVEHTLFGFKSAQSAIVFGNTVESLVNTRLGKQKFRQQIGSPDTSLAITESWTGPTVLKTCFLELKADMSEFICNQISVAVANHNELHGDAVVITEKTVREKPQPQYIST